MKANSVYLYTDGSSLGNPGPGGYGLICKTFKIRYRPNNDDDIYLISQHEELPYMG